MTHLKKLLKPIGFMAMLLSFQFSSNAQNCAVNAGTDFTICSNAALNLTGFATIPQSTPPYYKWRLVAGSSAVTFSNSSALNTQVFGFVPGSYLFELRSGCSIDTATDRVLVTVIQTPGTPFAGNDVSLCSSSTLTMGANSVPSPMVGTWSANGGTFSNINSPTSSYTPPTAAGVYTLTWTVVNGVCTNSDNMTVSIVGGSGPVDAGPNINLTCSGNCAGLNASNPGLSPAQSGFWSVVSGPTTPVFTNPNLRNTTACNLAAGTYVLNWTVSGTCLNGTDNVTITVLNTFQPPNTGPDRTYIPFCNPSSITTEVISANPLTAGERGKWRQIAGGTTSTYSPSDTNATVTIGNLTGTFPYIFRYVTTNSFGCKDSGDHIIVHTSPVTSLSSPSNQTLNCDVTSTSFNITYSDLPAIEYGLNRSVVFVSGPLNPGNGNLSSSSASLGTRTDVWSLANMTDPGTYVFNIVYSNMCGTVSRSISIIVSRTPGVINAGSDITLPCGQTFVSPVASKSGVGSISWSQVSGPNTATLSGANGAVLVMTNLIVGTYTMRSTLTGGAKCLSKNDLMIVVVPPNPVTPSNAGPDATLCAGRIRLNGNALARGETGTWTVSPSSGITFTPNANTRNAFVNGIDTNRVYTFVWTITSVCGTSRDTVRYTTSRNFAPPIPNAGSDQCLGSGTTSLTLTGSTTSGATVLWTALTTGSSVVSPTSRITNVNITGGSGVYLFKYELSTTGCTSFTDTVSVSINNSTSSVNAGTDQDICGNPLPTSATITATPSPSAGSVALWSQISGPNAATLSSPNTASTGVSNLFLGTYEFQYAITTGTCPAVTDVVTIDVKTPPSIAAAGLDQNICGTSGTASVTMAATAPTTGTGTWSLLSGPTSPTITTPTSNTSTITNLSEGVYTFRWTVRNGISCASSFDDVTITVTVAAFAGADATICSATSANLFGNVNTTGTWSNVSGTPAPTITANSTFSAIASGLTFTSTGKAFTFRYSLPARNGCPASSDDVTIINFAPPSQANAGADIELCFNATTATLVGNTPASGIGRWFRESGPNTPSAGTANTTYFDTALTNVAVGLHVWRYEVNTHSSCIASIDRMQIIRETTANAGLDIRICNEDTVSLNATAAIVNTGTWSLVSGPNTPNIVNPNNPKTQITGTIPGTYQYRWTIAGPLSCAVNSDDVQVLIDPPVTGIFAGRDTTIWINQSVQLGKAPTSGITYVWSPTSFLNNSAISNPIFSIANSPGTYQYTLTGSLGTCSMSDQVNIVVRNPSISGTVYNDADGYLDNDVDGVGINTPETGSPIYAYLVQGNIIMDRVAVAANGKYTLGRINTFVDYTVVISTIVKNIGDNAPLCVLPTNWVNTGEEFGNFNLSGTGLETGASNGTIGAKADTANVVFVDFGIQKRPDSDNKNAPSQLNPGGTIQVLVPTLTGTDREDGTLNGSSNDTVVIKTLPTNGKLYYNNVLVTVGQIIPNFNSTLLKVDPDFNGVGTIIFTYVWKDGAGFEDLSPATVTMPFTGLNISGTVFHDKNGVTDNDVNGIPKGVFAGQKLYAYLINSTNEIIDSVHVKPTTGAFLFDVADANSNYRVLISTNQYNIYSPGLPVGLAPINWRFVGEEYGINNNAGTGVLTSVPDGVNNANTTTFNITNVDFGIEYPTYAHDKSYIMHPDSVKLLTGRTNFTHWFPLVDSVGTNDTTFASSNLAIKPGKLSGFDLEQGRFNGQLGAPFAKVFLTLLPDTNNAVLQYNNILLYPNPAPANPAYIYWNPSNSRYEIPNFNMPDLKMLVKMNYQLSTMFRYGYIDSANVDGRIATYIVSYSMPLETSFLFFKCASFNKNTQLTWTVADASETEYFEIQKSKTGKDFVQLGKLETGNKKQGIQQFTFIDKTNEIGTHYYKIASVQSNQKSVSSPVCYTQIYNNSSLVNLTLTPNPAEHTSYIEINTANETAINFQIIDVNGKVISEFNNTILGSKKIAIDLSAFAPGMYQVRASFDNTVEVMKLIKY